jgi:hypothetical protein
MNWFFSHAYIATWISPLIALVGLIIRNRDASTHRISWSRVMIYVAFLTFLAAAMTPLLDLPTRYFAGTGVSVLLGYFMVDRSND